MEDKQESLISTKLTRQIRSFSAGKDDLYKLFKILKERNDSARDIEVANFKQVDQTAKEYEENRQLLYDSFELKITVNGSDGSQLYGSVSEIFESPNFPERVQSIFSNSATVFEVRWNFVPRNRFELLLDFSKPRLLDFSFLPSQATPNPSAFAVSGYDTTWVHGVFNEASTFVDNHRARGTWFHKHSVYDLLLYAFGFPFAFWVVYKSSGYVARVFGGFSEFVKAACYVYVFVASLIIFRVLFHYARWLWPLLDYQTTSDKATKHRVVLCTIVIGLIIALIYDLVKTLT